MSRLPRRRFPTVRRGGAPAKLPTNLPSPLRFNLDAVLDADPAPILTRITIGLWCRCSPCRWSTAGPVPQKSLRVVSGPSSSISSPTSSPTGLPSHASWKMSSPVSLISSTTSGPPIRSATQAENVSPRRWRRPPRSSELPRRRGFLQEVEVDLYDVGSSPYLESNFQPNRSAQPRKPKDIRPDLHDLESNFRLQPKAEMCLTDQPGHASRKISGPTSMISSPTSGFNRKPKCASPISPATQAERYRARHPRSRVQLQAHRKPKCASPSPKGISACKLLLLCPNRIGNALHSHGV